eukprot:SAG22_NODE_343_length_11944_cov_15.500042_4_plen_150_part_00
MYREPASFLANDPVFPGASNLRGTVAFGAEYDADEMAVNRSSELYINLADNQRLDAHGFAPVGRIVSGLAVVDKLYSGYGEMQDICSLHAFGLCSGPLAERIDNVGNAYLDEVPSPHPCDVSSFLLKHLHYHLRRTLRLVLLFCSDSVL